MSNTAAPIILMLVALTAAMPSRAQDKIEFFGGYSLTHSTIQFKGVQLCPGPPCPTSTFSPAENLNGWEASGTYRENRWLRFTADFSGHYGSAQAVNEHLYTYLIGPQISLPGRISPFVHVLLGGAHESNGGGAVSTFAVSPASDNSFAAAVGFGVDLKWTRYLSVRAIQVDDLLTRFHSSTQHQPRLSAGLVFRF